MELDAALRVVRGVDPGEVAAGRPRVVPLRYEVPAPGGTATQPCDLDLVGAVSLIQQRLLSPKELLDSCLTAIDRTEPMVGAFARLGRIDVAEAGLLHGIPFAVKDVIDTANLATEYGSAVFAGRIPDRDAMVVSRMKAAGGVLVGKTATHEIAYGVSTPQVRNPWDPAKMCSGSSGGSAAALAARQVPAALGTDTGGSLRLPSAFCGTTAIKPTHGLVPRDGVMALAPSFDVVGPMARTAADCWLLLQVLAGTPPAQLVVPALSAADLRIGVTAGATMPELGAEFADITLPSPEVTTATATVLAFAEASSEFRQHVVRGAPFAEDIVALLEAGLTIPAADFLHAGRIRAKIRRDYDDLLTRVDLILLPTSPVTDLPHGLEGASLIPRLTPFTLPASLTGLPAIAFPCGFTESGMPIGAQLMGPAGSESLLAAAAVAYQNGTDWHTRKPPVCRREPT